MQCTTDSGWSLPAAAAWQPRRMLLHRKNDLKRAVSQAAGCLLSCPKPFVEQWRLQGSGKKVVRRVFCQQELDARHATVIPSRITPFSSDHGRQTGLGQISTTLGDHAGISGAVAFCFRQGGCIMMEGTIAGLLLHRYELWWCLVTVPATQSPPSACSPRQACPTSHPRHGASALACLSFGSQSITRYGAVESGHACLVVVLFVA